MLLHRYVACLVLEAVLCTTCAFRGMFVSVPRFNLFNEIDALVIKRTLFIVVPDFITAPSFAPF